MNSLNRILSRCQINFALSQHKFTNVYRIKAVACLQGNEHARCNNYYASWFCTTSNKKDILLNRRKELKTYIEHNKERLRDTEQRIKERGRVVLADIKETKDKVKGRVEQVIEKENIYTIPNFLCISRILLSPYLGMLIVQADFNFALGILGIAAVTDLLDGWIARTWESQSTKVGSFLDPMADKVLIATLFLTLTYANLIPIALTSIIVGRDVILVTAGFVIRYKSLPPPRNLSRYFDATLATAQLAPTFISKVNTAVQLLLVGSTLAAPVFQYVGHPALEYLWYVTGATTVAAGMSYVLSKNTYKFLKHKNTK
ncbi:PREDICTED: probable cardiolipin synthase (CMP-forming) [Nicrophorus vespilloides]|uniref:cardiolipin synthase (CMP-forming) n=1 Tax=Nicrophorus vespilloides TaxID=110193 RepID=A0ABM1N4H3_NICVS|nr:PREDICTED: probable cardiolipin synthase (CMP-forming) [Nicrophorus vespilloides]